MCARQKQRWRWLWIRLPAVAVGCALLWPLVRAPYVLHVGRTCGVVIPILSHAEVRVNDVTLSDRLQFDLTVRPPDNSPPLRLKPAIRSALYGLGLITFIALVLALPDVPWRRRVTRALLGIVVLHVIQILTGLFDVFMGLAGDSKVPWPGDTISDLFPVERYFETRDYLSLLVAQVMPVLLWLVIFVYPIRRKGTGAAPRRPHQSRPSERSRRRSQRMTR
ncbi:MAG TPA: hypothetical protein VM118_04970 [Acidobacteriota bacterium]|nr:hypothetical protein [Acidobacteriota bacterium]